MISVFRLRPSRYNIIFISVVCVSDLRRIRVRTSNNYFIRRRMKRLAINDIPLDTNETIIKRNDDFISYILLFTRRSRKFGNHLYGNSDD